MGQSRLHHKISTEPHHGVDDVLGSPPALPHFFRLFLETAFILFHTVIVVGCKRDTYSLSYLYPVAPSPLFLIPKKKYWLFLSLPGLCHLPSWTQDRWPWGKGNLSKWPVPEVSVFCLLTPSLQVQLTSLLLPLLSLLTCLLTCTDQLYQQLEQNRRLTNQLKLALNED